MDTDAPGTGLAGSPPDGAGPYDVVVVGGGPAGLSAATWLGRYRRSVLVIDSGEYRNRYVARSHGYLGADPADPMALLDRARREAVRYPTVTTVAEQATDARADGHGRFLVTVNGRDLVALRIVLATGVVDELPAVDGFFDYYGRSVFHCPSCDGYEARNRRVVVLGWTRAAAGFALDLLDWAGSLTVVTEGRRFHGDEQDRDALARHSVTLVEDDAVRLLGADGQLRAVRLGSGVTVDADLMFFSIAHRPRLRLARQLGCAVSEEGCVLVDEQGRTSVEGVYAAGDLTPGFQLVPVAVGKGATAGVACATSFQGEQGSPNSPTPAPDPHAELSR